MSRRHDSLIPLSQQHQHALAAAVTIRRRFGQEPRKEAAWCEEMAMRIGELYTDELSGHFEVEESVLFRQMERYLGELPLVGELRSEHLLLGRLVRGLEEIPVLAALDEFAMCLELHVHKEERQLFAEFEQRMPEEAALRLGHEIEARLAKVCPRL